MAEFEATPSDPTRARWAMLFDNFCWRLLVYHEAAHVICRHFWLLSQQRLAASLCDNTHQVASNALFYHALEMEADQMAAILVSGELARHSPEDELAMHAAHIAMMLVPMLFDSGASTIEDYRSSDHPHPIVRFESMRKATMPNQEIDSKKVQMLWDRTYDLVLHEVLDAGFKINLPSSVLVFFQNLLANPGSVAGELRTEIHRIEEEATRLTQLRNNAGLSMLM